MTRRVPAAVGASLLALLLIAGAAPAATGAATTLVVSPDTMLGRIARARSFASSAESDPSRRAMAAVRTTLGLPVTVRFAAGDVLLEEDGFLSSLSGARSYDFSHAVVHLDALDAAIRDAAAMPPVDRSRVAAALADSYAGIDRPSITERYLVSIRELLVRLVARFIDELNGSNGIGRAIAWIVVIAALAAVVAVLRRLGVGFVGERAAPRLVSARPVDWNAEAEAAAASGDQAAATIALYHALLSTLAARGVVSDDPAVTAGECRAAVAKNLARAYGHVAAATTAFERIAYGGAPAEASDVEVLRAANRAVAA